MSRIGNWSAMPFYHLCGTRSCFLSTHNASLTVFIWTVCAGARVRACALRLTAVCFLMLCNCHVDILRGLACISHLCRSGCFVFFDYYGRPPVVISHFGGTFKMPPQQHRAPLHSRDSSVLRGEVEGYSVSRGRSCVERQSKSLVL